MPTDAQQKVLACIDDDEIARLACDLVRIPSFTTEETPCAEWLAHYLAGQGLEVLRPGLPTRRRRRPSRPGPARSRRSG